MLRHLKILVNAEIMSREVSCDRVEEETIMEIGHTEVVACGRVYRAL